MGTGEETMSTQEPEHQARAPAAGGRRQHIAEDRAVGCARHEPVVLVPALCGEEALMLLQRAAWIRQCRADGVEHD